MPNHNYNRGVKRERRTQQILETAGYRTLRSAGSHGDFDVVGYNAVGVLFVQCKLDRDLTPAEREQLAQIQLPPNCLKLVHRYRTGRKDPEIITVA
jgi:Holliday junction resolvase